MVSAVAGVTGADSFKCIRPKVQRVALQQYGLDIDVFLTDHLKFEPLNDIGLNLHKSSRCSHWLQRCLYLTYVQTQWQ